MGANMANINRSIKFLRIVVVTALVLLLTAHFWFWLSPYSFDFITLDHAILDDYGGIEALNAKQKLLGFAISSVPLLAMLWSLVLLFRLTTILAAGQWFDRLCEDYCIKVGRWLVIYVVLDIAHRTALVGAITMENQPGNRHFAISFSSDDLLALVPALLALIIGHMVRLAREQQDELNEII